MFQLSRHKGEKTWRLAWLDPKTGAKRRHDTNCRLKSDAQLWYTMFLQGQIPGTTPETLTGRAVQVEDTELTWEDLVAEYRRAKQIEKGGRLNPNWGSNYLTPFKKIGQQPVSAMNRADYERLRDWLFADCGLSTTSVRKYMQSLNAALRFGRRKGLVDPQLVQELTTDLTLPQDNPPQRAWLTPAEAARVYKFCLGAVVSSNRRWKTCALVVLLLKTGVRRGAAVGLTWDRVDTENGVINFHDPAVPISNKRRVEAPIGDNVRSLIHVLRKLTGPQITGNSGAGKVLPGLTPTILKNDVRWLREQTGIPRLTYKILRPTWASLNVQRGVPLEIVARGLGDTVEMTKERYAHLQPGHMSAAYE